MSVQAPSAAPGIVARSAGIAALGCTVTDLAVQAYPGTESWAGALPEGVSSKPAEEVPENRVRSLVTTARLAGRAISPSSATLIRRSGASSVARLPAHQSVSGSVTWRAPNTESLMRHVLSTGSSMRARRARSRSVPSTGPDSVISQARSLLLGVRRSTLVLPTTAGSIVQVSPPQTTCKVSPTLLNEGAV